MRATRKIYILLTRFPGKTSRAIGIATRCYYTHASIGLEEDLNTFYSFVGKGFIVEKITRYAKPGRTPLPCQLYELEVPEKAYDTLKKMLQLFERNKMVLRYTSLGVVLSLMHIPYKRKHQYFCSQFVAEILEYAQAARLKKNSALYHPGDFRSVPGIRLHFQGNLHGMLHQLAIAPHLV